MRKLTLALVVFIATPFEAVAQQSANFTLVSPPTPTRRYGLAGCGLGSVLLPNGPQAAVSIVNGLFWNQVFMISSGTSNCQNDTLRQANVDQEQYMIANFRNIAKEAAQGTGESLSGLATVLGCNENDEKIFFEVAQKNHQKIFSQPGALAALHSLKTQINSEKSLALSCQNAKLSDSPREVR